MALLFPIHCPTTKADNDPSHSLGVSTLHPRSTMWCRQSTPLVIRLT